MPNDGKIIPVLLAGGGGTRLWPVSRGGRPKQFQALAGPLSTYQLALRRVAEPALFHDPVVITGEIQRGLALRQAAEVGSAPLVVAEPIGRDSAAAVAVAAVLGQRRTGDGLVLALAADALIDDDGGFRDAVRRGVAAAMAGDIVVFGLRADAALTSLGYIKPGAALAGDGDVRRVESFAEKPDAAAAKAYVAAGYLWNSGCFLFRADVMIQAFAAHAPDILAAALAAVDGARTDDGVLYLDAGSFAKARKMSVDHAIMEKVTGLAVVTGDFRWSDLGSWAAVAEALPQDQAGNAIAGRGLAFDSRDCLIHSPDIVTVAIGVHDLAIVATGDAVLVMAKDRAQDLKGVVAELAARRLPEAGGGAKNYSLREIHVEPGRSCALEASAGRLWIVVKGAATVAMGAGQETIASGEPIIAQTGEMITIANDGRIPLELLEVDVAAGR